MKQVQPSQPELIDSRYQIEETIGQGGMAVVYRVLDTNSNQRHALKQLFVDKENKKQEQIAALFEHEYYTLAQLTHPRVVEVYDFGRSDSGPYYTMEFLDGGDLRELSPLPWKRLCSILCDICSALSLLHSRRQVHRDLTPRNVRCTQDGRAKLIDFGAMVPMSVCKHVVGTPPFVAPESVNFQSLDARVDLYALGATAYYALTGRHAFPAKNFRQLPDLWRSTPRQPSDFVKDIPKDLDNLILSLISLDPMARPVNAAAVMDKLHAIAGIEIDEQLLVAQSYLSAPTLVGRETQLLRVRKQMIRLLRRRGGSFVVESESGAGRSRFLDACVLEGKLAGAIALRADASDSHQGQWSTARALFEQLMDAAPDLVISAIRPHRDVMEQVFPDLIRRCLGGASSYPAENKETRLSSRCTPCGGPSANASTRAVIKSQNEDSFTDGKVAVSNQDNSRKSPSLPVRGTVEPGRFDRFNEMRSQVQIALCDIFLEVCTTRSLMLAIDDIHKIDEPSAAFIALLVHDMYSRKLMVVATLESRAPVVSSNAIRLLSGSSTCIELEALTLKDTERLLSSIFGEVTNLAFLADRIYSISHGNPRAIMQLTQHLVDKGIVQYRAGAWTLPTNLSPSDIPDNLTDALRARVERLDREVLNLAATIALSPKHGFSYNECIIFCGENAESNVIQYLGELVTISILTTDGTYWALSQESWTAILLERLSEEEKRSAHLKLAEVFTKRETDDFRVAQHLLKGGQEERALDVIVRFTEAHKETFEKDRSALVAFLVTLPTDWYETFSRLRQVQRELKRAKKQHFSLGMNCLLYSIVDGSTNRTVLLEMFEELYQATGLATYDELDESMDPSSRLMRALELAQQRYEAMPEMDRTLAPADAIRALAQCIVRGILLAGTSYDHSLIRSFPSLEPFIPLSPALDTVVHNVNNTYSTIVANYEEALHGFYCLLDRLPEPECAGIEAGHVEYVRLSLMFTIGALEASFGIKSALDWAAKIEIDPLFEVNAWRIRTMYYLCIGDEEQANICKNMLERLRIQNSPAQFFEGTHLYAELSYYVIADDLTQVRQLVPDIEKMAKSYETWLPVLYVAQGEVQRIRGDYANALAKFSNTLELIGSQPHIVWPRVAAAYLKTLFALHRYSEAKEAGQRFLKISADRKYGIACLGIREVLALVDAIQGEYTVAIENAQFMIELCHTLHSTGVYLGIAYETRAQIAIQMENEDDFVTYAKLCAEQYNVGCNSALTARYERMISEASQFRSTLFDETEDGSDISEAMTATISSMISRLLMECHGSKDRAQEVLRSIVYNSNCKSGFLYVMRPEGPVLAAKTDPSSSSAQLDKIVRDYLSAEIRSSDEVTMTQSDIVTVTGESEDAVNLTTETGERYRPLLLGHKSEEGQVVTGLAVLKEDPNKKFSFPEKTIIAVSKTLLEVGDVTLYYAAD